MKIISLIKSVHDHGKSCDGNIVIRRSSVLQKRLSLQVIVKCTKKNNCNVWANGFYKWTSSAQILIPKTSRLAFVPDVLYALATYITPTTKAHAEQFLSSMLLTPLSRNLLNDLVSSLLYLSKMMEKMNLRQFFMFRSQHYIGMSGMNRRFGNAMVVC